MVARLKLKEIDGRAPPGVNCSCSAPESSPRGPVVATKNASRLAERRQDAKIAGNSRSTPLPSHASKGGDGQRNYLGTVTTWFVCDDPQPNPSGASVGEVQRLQWYRSAVPQPA